MPKIYFSIRTVPPPELTMLAECLCDKSIETLIGHMIEFGFPIALALGRGAKVATGTPSRYHALPIRLAGEIPRITNIPIEGDCEISDLPHYAHLQHIARIMRLATPELALPRLAYWFWIASQVAWMHHPLLIMDHAKEVWGEYRYPPLWDARARFCY